MARNDADDDAPRTFGRHLRALRRGAGLTQEQLAECAGFSIDTVGNLERGYRGSRRIDTATLLADGLDLSGSRRAAFFAAFDGASGQAMPADPALPAGLPRAPDGFFGRDGLLAAVGALLDDPAAQVVTLLGSGGVGKTRLALEAASRAAAAGRLVAWVALDSLETADEALPAIARAVGAAGPPQADPVTRIVEAIAGRDLLLVIDNWEHVLAAAPALSAVVAASPRLRVLATSREALRIAGEERIVVPPLPLPGSSDRDAAEGLANPAVALFLARAGVAGDAASLLPEVRRIVTALDGVPLAIELAAAQHGAFSVAAVAGLLERFGLSVLDTGRSDAAARQRSMDAAIEWSCRRLEERDRRLLRVLSVFRGGVDLELVAEVCERLGDPGLGGSLPALVRCSLAFERPDADGSPRFHLLSPIRLFAAAELAAAGEKANVEQAHRATMVGFAREARAAVVGPDPLAGLAAMDRERDNLTAALERAIRDGDARDAIALAAGMGLWWELRGEVAEGFRWLERALALPGVDAFPEDVSRAGRVTALLAGLLGRFDDVKRLADRMLDVATTADDLRGMAIALTWLGDHAWMAGGDLAAARAFHERAFGLAEPLGDSIELAQACDRLGDVLVELDDADAALTALDRSLAILARIGAPVFVVSTRTLRATALELAGRREEARASLVDVVATGQRYGAPMPVAVALMRIAAIDAEAGDRLRVACGAMLLGASDAAHARNRVAVDPLLAPVRERAIVAITATLGEPERDRLLADGRALSEAEALALAGEGDLPPA